MQVSVDVRSGNVIDLQRVWFCRYQTLSSVVYHGYGGTASLDSARTK
jgi:hypothetical protein